MDIGLDLGLQPKPVNLTVNGQIRTMTAEPRVTLLHGSDQKFVV